MISFHHKLFSGIIAGAPPTLAVGNPVSGTSTAIEAALSLFNQKDCIGGKFIYDLMKSYPTPNILHCLIWLTDFSSLKCCKDNKIIALIPATERSQCGGMILTACLF